MSNIRAQNKTKDYIYEYIGNAYYLDLYKFLLLQTTKYKQCVTKIDQQHFYHILKYFKFEICNKKTSEQNEN